MIKRILLVLLGFLISTVIACGSSQAELDTQSTQVVANLATTQIAKAPTSISTPTPTNTPTDIPTATHTPLPTDTPIPTFTLTSTPTPTDTPTPTATSTPLPTSTPVPTFTSTPVTHLVPEPPPDGIPSPSTSEYLESYGGGFLVSVPENGDRWMTKYSIILTILRDLPTGAYMEAHFENPLHPSSPIVVGKEGPFGSEVDFESPLLTGVKCKNYWLDVHIYSDSTKTEQLGLHVQWLNSMFDIDKVQSVEDLTDRRTCER